MPTCSRCKRELPQSAFSKPYTDRKGRTYQRTYCKDCNRAYCRSYGQLNKTKRNMRLKFWRRDNPEKAHGLDKRKRLQKIYGLSTQEYEQLKEKCKGKCSLCGQHSDLELDHDHKTKRIRGFVCRKCNLLLGLLEDNGLSLEQIATYLDKPCHADVILKILEEKAKK